MKRFKDDFSSITEISSESELVDDFPGLASHGEKVKSTACFMRKIEIMQENKLLKSSIEDIYDD